ncbi:MAG: tetraacyldisaccharide 4'-kinase, partial [Limisphaerales bacterium]
MKNPILSVLSGLYGLGTGLRNKAYDLEWKRSFQFDFPIIGVGNLSAGGTGKTPCVAWLAKYLLPTYKVASLSRGYGRKTAGYYMGTSLSKVEDIGDEAKLLKRKFPDLEIAVSELRVPAIPAILEDEEGIQVILLDDCFQHRALIPGLQILLTPYEKLYTEDDLLPLGRLREYASGAARADIIIVTKCPDKLNHGQREEVLKKLNPNSNQKVFFAGLKYGIPYPLTRLNSPTSTPPSSSALLVTGIAWADPLVRYTKSKWAKVEHIEYPDHYKYGPLDFDKMITQLDAIDGPAFVLTTEKD